MCYLEMMKQEIKSGQQEITTYNTIRSNAKKSDRSPISHKKSLRSESDNYSENSK